MKKNSKEEFWNEVRELSDVQKAGMIHFLFGYLDGHFGEEGITAVRYAMNYAIKAYPPSPRSRTADDKKFYGTKK